MDLTGLYLLSFHEEVECIYETTSITENVSVCLW